MQIRDVTANDLDDVLALNEASVPHVNGLSADEMRWFFEHAAYFRQVRRDEQLAGFLVGLMQGLDYEYNSVSEARPRLRYKRSSNDSTIFQWHRRRRLGSSPNRPKLASASAPGSGMFEPKAVKVP